MKTSILVALAILLPLAGFSQTPQTRAQFQKPDLGEAAPVPSNLPLNPSVTNGAKPRFQTITGGFVVNTDSREEVRSFYNAIYPTSENVPQNSTADVTSCTPGHNDNAFQLAELRRINWFRAMAGLPAAIYLDPIDNWGSQQMAVIISANNALNHNPPSSYTCYNTFAAHYAGGDQALGTDGSTATTDFIWDYGAGNNEVGHRRWLLYPPEIVMGLGDVPASPGQAAGNLTYVFDPASFGTRPATRQPYVAWPPEGYAPHQVVFPYWSFGLSNADLSAATVTMTSNGVAVSTIIQPYQTGFGDNTLVWVPMGLDATTGGTSFPFNGSDTTYNVTIGNIKANGATFQYSYHVIVFDPQMPGADYIPATVTGPAQIAADVGAVFSITPPNNSHITSYNLLSAQLVAGSLSDNGANGLVNFTLTPGPNYPPTTSQPFSSGTCFNLQHLDTNSYPQLLQLNEVLVPSANTTVTFQSELGYTSPDEVARVQVSPDGGANWTDLYAQAGNDSYESTFTSHTLSLSNYAGTTTLLRFNFDFQGGSYYNGGFPLGWYITGIVITNTEAQINQATNNSSVTNIISGNLADSALAGLINFTMTSPFPYYYVITNPPVGAESKCFHLTHLDPTSQFMQFNELLLPSTNALLNFSSQLATSTSDETARIQASTNNGTTWDDLYVQAGGSGETTFTPRSLSLSNYAGRLTLLRFNFAFTGGSFYPQSDNYIGWNIEDIVLTNVQQQVISIIDSANLSFAPAAAGTYVLQAQPVIFSQFPLPSGPLRQVVVTSSPILQMSSPVLSNNQVLLNFSALNISNVTGSTFHLLQANTLGTNWNTNTTATFSTNSAGSYRFTTTNNASQRFYEVRTP